MFIEIPHGGFRSGVEAIKYDKRKIEFIGESMEPPRKRNTFKY